MTNYDRNPETEALIHGETTVKAPYAECWRCPLKDRPCVPSHLPHQAAVIVVGEAPGKTEVDTGMPF